MSLVPRTFRFDKYAFEPDKALERTDRPQAPKPVGQGAKAEVKSPPRDPRQELPPQVKDLFGSREKFPRDWSQPFFKIRSLWNPVEDPALMQGEKKILVGFEGNEDQQEFLVAALKLAERYQCEILLARILGPKSAADIEKSRDELQDWLFQARSVVAAQYLQKFSPEVMVETHSDPAEGLMKIAHRETCSLILVGHQKKSAAEVLAMGSVSEKVLKGSPCPVMVWKDPKVDFQIQQVLVPMDGTPFSYPAIVQAIMLCQEFGANLLLFHVMADGGQREQKIQSLQRILSQMDWKNVKHDLVTHSGDVLKTLTTFCRTQSVDLVVMGTHPPHSSLSSLTRSIAVELIRSVSCPVMVVHPQ